MEQVDSLKTDKKFKKTEIGEIPVDWEIVKLKDIAEIGSGDSAPQGAKYFENGEYLFIRTSDVGQVRRSHCFGISVDKVNDLAVQKFGLRQWPKGTILFPKSGASTFLNHRVLLSRPACVSSHLATIVAKNQAVAEFLYYYLLTIDARSLVPASNYPSLRLGDLATLSVPLPLLSEQKKIAEILSTVDEAIEKSDDVIEKTKELKKGLMQELLTRGIGHKKFKKTKIGEIPEEWDIKPISKTCNINPPKREINSLADVKEVSFLPMEFVKEDGEGIMEMEIREISEVLKGYTYFRENDILFSKITPCMENGKIAIASNLRNGIGFGSTEFHVLRPNIKLLLPETLFYWILRKPFRDAAKNFFTGTAGQQRVQKGFFDVVKIPLPPLPEQRKIAGILSTVDEEIEREVDNKKKLETIKKGLMQVLLTGKKRVKV